MKNKNLSGQSLIEAIIAISILTIGFLGIASLLARALFLNRVVSDEITANYLADEGVEIAKNLIDHDVYAQLGNVPGATGWGTCFARTPDVELDYNTTNCLNLVVFNPPGNPLLYNPTTHLYGYTPAPGDITTGFTREVMVNHVPGSDEITVNVIVRWSTGSVIGESLNVEDQFYDWMQ